MSVNLTRKSVSDLAKLDLSGLSHMQRIDAIAKVFGFENNAALMGTLKAAEPDASITPQMWDQKAPGMGEPRTDPAKRGQGGASVTVSRSMGTLGGSSAAAGKDEVVVITAFGTGMSSTVSNMEEITADTDGDIVERRFATEAEGTAYLKGLEDYDGWMEYAVAATRGLPLYRESDGYFETLGDNPDLSFKDWHNAEVAKLAEEDLDDDEDLEP